VLVANYGNGAVASFAIAGDGSLGAAVGGATPGQNAHMIVTDPASQFALVPCLGSNYVAQFRFDSSSGKLTPNMPATVAPAVAGAPSPSGPRHVAFHPGGKVVYLINETASTMTAYSFDAAGGTLTPLQTLSTLPSGTSAAGNTGAEVWVHPSGRFLYGSNRGNDSIAVFTLDAAGKMSFATTVRSGGATPRSFTLDPSGAWMLVANQNGNNVVVFRVDPGSGVPSPVGAPTTLPSPSFVGVVLLPGA
jgi:6-phosphogluconolactonase